MKVGHRFYTPANFDLVDMLDISFPPSPKQMSFSIVPPLPFHLLFTPRQASSLAVVDCLGRLRVSQRHHVFTWENTLNVIFSLSKPF